MLSQRRNPSRAVDNRGADALRPTTVDEPPVPTGADAPPPLEPIPAGRRLPRTPAPTAPRTSPRTSPIRKTPTAAPDAPAVATAGRLQFLRNLQPPDDDWTSRLWTSFLPAPAPAVTGTPPRPAPSAHGETHAAAAPAMDPRAVHADATTGAPAGEILFPSPEFIRTFLAGPPAAHHAAHRTDPPRRKPARNARAHTMAAEYDQERGVTPAVPGAYATRRRQPDSRRRSVEPVVTARPRRDSLLSVSIGPTDHLVDAAINDFDDDTDDDGGGYDQQPDTDAEAIDATCRALGLTHEQFMHSLLSTILQADIPGADRQRRLDALLHNRVTATLPWSLVAPHLATLRRFGADDDTEATVAAAIARSLNTTVTASSSPPGAGPARSTGTAAPTGSDRDATSAPPLDASWAAGATRNAKDVTYLRIGDSAVILPSPTKFQFPASGSLNDGVRWDVAAVLTGVAADRLRVKQVHEQWFASVNSLQGTQFPAQTLRDFASGRFTIAHCIVAAGSAGDNSRIFASADSGVHTRALQLLVRTASLLFGSNADIVTALADVARLANNQFQMQQARGHPQQTILACFQTGLDAWTADMQIVVVSRLADPCPPPLSTVVNYNLCEFITPHTTRLTTTPPTLDSAGPPKRTGRAAATTGVGHTTSTAGAAPAAGTSSAPAAGGAAKRDVMREFADKHPSLVDATAPTAAGKLAQYCRHFVFGSCSRGAECRYSHSALPAAM